MENNPLAARRGGIAAAAAATTTVANPTFIVPRENSAGSVYVRADSNQPASAAANHAAAVKNAALLSKDAGGYVVDGFEPHGGNSNLIIYATYDASVGAAEDAAGDYAQPANKYRVGAEYEYSSALPGSSLHSDA